jgi:hypothetical protein
MDSRTPLSMSKRRRGNEGKLGWTKAKFVMRMRGVVGATDTVARFLPR